jgi:hypothetical protein
MEIIEMNYKEWRIDTRHFFGGFTLFNYQLAFGMSLRWWETRPAMRFYFGPFKLWFTVKTGNWKGGN